MSSLGGFNGSGARRVKKTKFERLLLRSSDHVPASDVQDPLGLGLRGSTRLTNRLLVRLRSSRGSAR